MTNDGAPPSPGGQPHDALFRLVFSDPENAGSELRSVLPPELAAHIDLDALTLQEGTFVDDALRHRQADILFSTTVAGHDAYLYVMIEHQSTPDPLMALRMLGYQLQIWERHLDEHAPQPGARPLPLIIPIVVYQGRRRWKAPTDIAGLLDVPDELATAAGDLMPRFGFMLDDLTLLDDDTLRARPLSATARVTFVAFTHGPGSSDITTRLRDWTDDLAQVDLRRLVGIFNYLVRVGDTPPQTLIKFAATLGTEAEEAAVTTAEQLIAEGEARGEARGEVKGQARLLVSMLTHKFGELDTDRVHLIEQATSRQIDEWSTRLIEGAATVDEIFA